MPRGENVNLADEELWKGGYFEAAIVLGKSHDAGADARLHSAISEVWTLPYLRNCSADRSGKGDIDPAAEGLERIVTLYGWFDDPRTGSLPFTTSVVRETEEPDGDDWLYAAVPLGGLCRKFPAVGGWPASDHETARSWIEPVEGVLAEIAIALSHKVPFAIAAIGYEISGAIGSSEYDGVIPDRRRIGYVVPQDGIYCYLPTTVWS